MKFSTRFVSSVFAASVMVGATSLTPVWAQEVAVQAVSAKTIVDQAKADKLIGEKLTGYLDFVTQDVSAEIRAAVNEINIKRKSIYTNLASEQNVGVSVVAGLTGEKLVAKAKPGEMVKLADGQWHIVGS